MWSGTRQSRVPQASLKCQESRSEKKLNMAEIFVLICRQTVLVWLATRDRFQPIRFVPKNDLWNNCERSDGVWNVTPAQIGKPMHTSLWHHTRQHAQILCAWLMAWWSKRMHIQAPAWQRVGCSGPVHDNLCCMSLPFSLSHFPVYLSLITINKGKKTKTNL